MPNNNPHEISLQTAIDMTTLYRANRPQNFPLCETFEKEAITSLLATEGCAFLRIYYGMKPDLQAHAILIAANTEGDDILPQNDASAAGGGSGTILEDGFRCPPACPKPSPLNP